MNNKEVKKKVKNSKTKKESNNYKSKKTKSNSSSEKGKIVYKIKKRRKIKFLIVFLIISFVIIGVSYLLFKTPNFNIKNITIEGNDNISSEEILKNSNINVGDNLFLSYFKIDKNKIKSYSPYIESVKTDLQLPDKFKIKIQKRVSKYFAYDKEKNVYYKLDENGYIVELCDKVEMKTNELLVIGITFDNEVVLGQKINEIDYSKVLIYNDIFKEYSKIFTNKITKVSFENSLTTIYLEDRLQVILPNNTNLKYNLDMLKEIISAIGDQKGVIDMTKNNPTFIAY
jgi:cell division protein FtsQ